MIAPRAFGGMLCAAFDCVTSFPHPTGTVLAAGLMSPPRMAGPCRSGPVPRGQAVAGGCGSGRFQGFWAWRVCRPAACALRGVGQTPRSSRHWPGKSLWPVLLALWARRIHTPSPRMPWPFRPGWPGACVWGRTARIRFRFTSVKSAGRAFASRIAWKRLRGLGKK